MIYLVTGSLREKDVIHVVLYSLGILVSRSVVYSNLAPTVESKLKTAFQIYCGSNKPKIEK